jgi:hypothetical protein
MVDWEDIAKIKALRGTLQVIWDTTDYGGQK